MTPQLALFLLAMPTRGHMTYQWFRQRIGVDAAIWFGIPGAELLVFMLWCNLIKLEPDNGFRL